MEVKSAKFIISNTQVDKCPKHGLPEYAFIGRSNVGKSSLINMLTGRKSLAMTSATPGKTILINHFLINESWYLVDLPGYGFAARSKKMQSSFLNMINNYILDREELTLLFVLIDSRLEPQKIDVDFMRWLGENGIPFTIIFTKADKLSHSKLSTQVMNYLERLKEDWEELPPYIITSSKDKTGRDTVLEHIDVINRQLQLK